MHSPPRLSSEHMEVLTQSDTQEINGTLTFLLTRPGYLCVSPTTTGTVFIARLGEQRPWQLGSPKPFLYKMENTTADPAQMPWGLFPFG